MKCLVYQVNVGDPPAYYADCTRSVNDYCRRYNFDYMIQRDPITRLRPVNSHRSVQAVERLGYLPHFEKVNAFDYLDLYDRLAIIDADIFIKDNAPNLFDELGDATFAGVRECDMPLDRTFRDKVKRYSLDLYGNLPEMEKVGDQIPFFNTGVMLINNPKFIPYLNGETPEQFIKRKEFERFVNGEGKWKWASDQTIFNWWFQKENIETKALDWKWNALYNSIAPKKLREAYFIHFFRLSRNRVDQVDIHNLVRSL